MITYEDLLNVKSEKELQDFILSAIQDHKNSEIYQQAVIAYDYYRKRNVSINNFRKLLYTITGDVVPDNFSANYKISSAFFPIFVKQEVAYLLGNGITFNDNNTKTLLGGDSFDNVMMNAGYASLWGGVAFLFFNFDHIQYFSVTEFVPLWGEEDGALHAGIKFWQIAQNKPLRATLFEEDGLTEFIWRNGECSILKPKTAYKNIINEDGSIDYSEGQNYPSFPIVPMWGNNERQSELVGLRETIDCYDLIFSGFANTVDEASTFYWSITNSGGMQDIDLVKFVERMKTIKAAVVDDQGSKAEAHTLDLPFEARANLLAQLRDALYRDSMALDTDKISAGQVTATAINASYENITLKSNGFENCVTESILNLLKLIGVEDAPRYKYSKIINMKEDTEMILNAAQYLDDETILNHLPFLSPDEINNIMERKEQEEASRYEDMKAELEELKNEVQSRSEAGFGETEINNSTNEDFNSDSEDS